MSIPNTRPGNPDRGWNDPPMFNYAAGTAPVRPRHALNKRVAFPMSSNPSTTPGHAVLSPSQGPPIMNPVLPADLQGPPQVPPPPLVPIGPRDTPLGNQAPPVSSVQLLPPTTDLSTPEPVPILVAALVPSSPTYVDPQSDEVVSAPHLDKEGLDELMSRLSLKSDEGLLDYTLDKFQAVLNKFSNILTKKVIDDISKKLELLGERWRKASLSEQVRVRTVQLAIALHDGETEKASHLQLALVVDHIAEVNQWIMGVKRLIQQQQLSEKEIEIISENRQSSERAQTEQSETTDSTNIFQEFNSASENLETKTNELSTDAVSETNEHSADVGDKNTHEQKSAENESDAKDASNNDENQEPDRT
ncbi:steroid receptor RNA activator 1-like isoform X2 [Dreissena polymorpha]|uniref:SRA1/Sec31 domain-containing protein n=1 Tax=Dreissena polymorpha TaxID=45954 RepID=A0A9D4ELC0_DREPO|nr:steroid receptor RNA activator 1-like isoform X2 [Dreissena polymorpha]XP_052228218.1 steroid receptor RNA activator 1-like isoform X2 [Dreissena polymorpha]XP_052228219.1 steroid receptor RNA activator 1-like isoform X2 [Dreissena polymorpha]XP_052228220.1 steroid receptor RNA activator 1-like isoform X2 [Dreissena polymorpha]XP_052228221.1 steroid receptor RNA activator 1-like isoform X2 [Dreissena polymorpha]KAH3781711.1 hypothetical protein DPMN_159614 [Dreissena polymorpha]